jgi:hypothetical protein
VTIGEDLKDDRLDISYDGPGVTRGRMNMLALAGGLRGFAQLAERSNELLNGKSLPIQVETDSYFENGSLSAPVYILHDISRSLDFFASSEITGLTNLIALLGFSLTGGISLFRLFKRHNGQRIEKVDRLADVPNSAVPALRLIEIYNDAEVRVYLRRTLGPLHYPGVEEFRTRRARRPIDLVTKSELDEADAAEVAALTTEDELLLDIEKIALKRTLSWHFFDGFTSFDARIDDDRFWARIEGGERFGDGDRLRVRLRTNARRLSDGRVQMERRIPEVLEIEHRYKRGRDLFVGQDEA